MKILNLWERVIYALGGRTLNIPGEFGFGILNDLLRSIH